MNVLAIRTDKPQAELYIYKDGARSAEIKWQAHRELAETLNTKAEEILNKSSISYDGLGGIVIYKGPGSFTGLRIGVSVANAVAYAKNIPIVGETGGTWTEQGLANLKAGKNHKIVIPEYGAPANVTQPKK